MENVSVRPFRAAADRDLVPQITRLLHQAYAPLAQAGMKYLATHQTDEITFKRLTEGESFLAFIDEELAGTISLKEEKKAECEWYRKDGVVVFGQFGVHPKFQGRKIGAKLMELVEARAREKGFQEIALDTSEHAENLIATYTRRGYRFVEHAQWKITNYRSVVLSKSLEPRSP